MAGTTLKVLRQRVARGLGLLKGGTATGGAVGSLIDTNLLSLFDNDWFKGSGIVITYDAGDASAAPEGEKRTIKQSVQSSGTVLVFPDFTAAPANNDLYEIYRGFSVDDVEDAVNESVRMAAAGFWEPQVDVTKTWTTGTLDIDLSGISPAIDPLYGIDYVGVQLISSPATYPYSDVTGEVVFYWDQAVPMIQFFRNFPSGAKIKIAYRTRPTVMTTQLTTTGVTYADLDIYLRIQAVEQLAGAGFFGTESSDIEWRQERWGTQKAEVIFDKYRMEEPPGRVKTVAPHIPGLPLSRFTISIGE